MANDIVNRDDWGGVAVVAPETDDWGGVAIAAVAQTDDWGGVEVAPLGSPPITPTSSRLADAAARIPSEIAQMAAKTAQGLVKIGSYTPPGLLIRGLEAAQSAITGTPNTRAADTQQFMRDVQERAASDYGVDPVRDKDIASKVITGVASFLTVAAAGPAAPVAAGGLMAESAQQDAEAHGATPNQQGAAFALGGATGIVSEFLLGLPALIRSAKAAGLADDATKSLLRPIVSQAFKSAGRESGQEAIEQVTGNLIANTLVGYDPDRPTMEGVAEAAAFGAVIGGPVGGVVQAAASIDARGVEPEPTVAKDATVQPRDVQERQIAINQIRQFLAVNDEDASRLLNSADLENDITDVMFARGYDIPDPGDSPEHREATNAAIVQAADFIRAQREALPVSQQPAAAPVASTPASEVAPHLRPTKEVQAILAAQPTGSAPAATPIPPPEGGAAGGTGGRRPPAPTAIGTTPLGAKNWLRIPPWFKRVGRGLFTEGTRAVLGRTKNPVGVALAKATRQHVDIEQELYGQHEKMLHDAVKGVPSARQDAAFAEVSQHIRDVENGRPTPALAPDAQRILDAWYDVGKSTGDIARANGVQVWDAALGTYRPMGTVKDFIPRMFRKEVEAALRDPDNKKNTVLFNSLVAALAAHKGITPEQAAAELHTVAARFTAQDFQPNLELARLEQLPEIFYEYDLRNLIPRYLPAYSERMAQIIAYGQRLGTREAPIRKNLWDIAKGESRDPATQKWLDEAENQGTGFRPVSEGQRIAKRAQAVGNATLLSDPTTTVVRNLLSGLSVTSERFGIGRALRQLMSAGKTASRMDAREIGAIRDDIGAFLGAEDLGDSKFDAAIRKGQQVALKLSGFTGSETVVRTQNALTASAFARDAARALATNPKSALAREALAFFKRFDVDPEAIVAENGQWKTGPETRKFIRTAVRESQGGYRFDQVPLWAGTTTGRFIYQYGRWGIQRANDIFKNTIRPALGEEVEFRGQKMRRQNLLPLMRLGLMTVGLGEVFAAIASLLFDRDRRDSSLSEIAEAFTEDEGRAVGLLAERIVNDIIMAGTLGLIGQPIDFVKAVKDQSRFKNPLDPPSLSGVKTLIDLSVKAKDQGGSLTKRDWLDVAATITRGPKNVTDVARNVADEKLYEAQNDVRTLRNAARRWAKTQGMDVASKIGADSIRKMLNAPTFEALNDALMTGDAAKAKAVASEFIAKAADKPKARAAIRSSVEGRHPFRAGSFSAEKYQRQFLMWAKKNLVTADVQQVERVISTYDKTAKAAGLN